MDSATLFDLFSDDILLSSSPPRANQFLPPASPLLLSSLREPRPYLDFDTAQTILQHYLKFKPHPGQIYTLLLLYSGIDSILIAPCGWGKTIVITGLACLLPPAQHTITLIISPLKAIQQDQAFALQKELGNRFIPFILNGNTNSAENRFHIARGDFTHIWLSAEIATCEGSSKEIEKRRAITKRFPCGYEDTGDFLSVLQYEPFRQAIILVTIDELHLCTRQQWGGKFRPAMGGLCVLRQRLPDHIPMLGVTATLTKSMYGEIIDSAGFREHHLKRHSINRPSICLHFEATGDSIGIQKRIVLLIARETKRQHGYTGSKLTKSIFFVNSINDTGYLQRSIILWLVEFGFQEDDIQPFITTYHGELTDATRKRKQSDFDTGRLRIMVCTIAFAIGVNPPGVELVCQVGRCPLEDAIQKGGRGGRQGGGVPGGPSIFIWIVPLRIVGARALRPSIHIQTRQSQRRARGPSSSQSQSQLESQPESQPASQSLSQIQPSRLQSTTIGDLDDYGSDASVESVGSIDSMDYGSSRGRDIEWKAKPKWLSDEEWRTMKTFDGEWEVWNTKGCYRSMLLRPFEEILSEDPAFNCNGCNAPTCLGRPGTLSLLPLLPDSVPDEATTPRYRTAVKEALETLRVSIGARYRGGVISHPFAAGEGHVEPGYWILQKHDLKQFTRRYPAVSRGELFGWQWTKEYGQQVITAVRDAISWMPPVTPLVVLPIDVDQIPSAAGSPISMEPTRPALRDVTNVVTSTTRRTPRGAVAKKKRKGESGMRIVRSLVDHSLL